METLFIKLLNMSIAASWLVIAIIILRILLKKAPKALVCVLWAFVAVRLIFPISFESEMSLIPSAQTVPEDITNTDTPRINSGIPVLNDVVNPIISNSDVIAGNEENANAVNNSIQSEDNNSTVSSSDKIEKNSNVSTIQKLVSVASYVWIVGIVGMVLYATISYMTLYKKVNEAVEYKDNIWLCDRVTSPFILGIIRPRIILPSSMKEKEMEYVIAHEQAHLKRRDHLWKPLGFLLLTIYWFNLVMWVAYILLCRDIELACDEKVIKQMGLFDKKAYTTALLDYSISGKMITACPLAFGESGVKKRIKSVLSYKKPAFWVVIVAVIVCAGVGVMFLTNPKTNKEKDKEGNDLEVFITNAIWKHYEAARYDEYYYGKESHRTLDIVEKGEETCVYAWVLYSEYGHYRGDIEEISSEYVPTVITVKKDKKGYMGYSLVEYWTPKEGDNYEAEIKEKFPKNIQDEALNPQLYIKELQEECYEWADGHFKDEAWSEDKTTFTTETGYELTVEEYEKINWFWKESDIHSMTKGMIESNLKKTNFERKELINTYFYKYSIEVGEDVEYSYFDYEVNKSCDPHKVIAKITMSDENYENLKEMIVDSGIEKSDVTSCKNAILESDLGIYGEIDNFKIYGGEYESNIQVSEDVTNTGPAARFIMINDDTKEVYVYFYDSVLERTVILDSNDELYNGEVYDKEYYEYPDTEGMDGNSIISACRIKEVTLDRMTTKQLAQAVIDYPMLEIHYASSQSTGTSMLQNACDAYAEILTRDDAKDVLMAKVKEAEGVAASDDEKMRIALLKDIILDENRFRYQLTNNDKIYLEN